MVTRTFATRLPSEKLPTRSSLKPNPSQNVRDSPPSSEGPGASFATESRSTSRGRFPFSTLHEELAHQSISATLHDELTAQRSNT
ncbi:unnamed protein product [Danaus chrysippus]|uniref:(African queen) hypothetical protein n=1 Tax=Danaus chrysippus TaxID=151541 RepID=A0A8J2RCN1_9NEOP|nr:unnamed protein product [Danaus chrysippus]